MTTTTISEHVYTRPDGEEQSQYRTTVPKDLAESFGLAGETVEWNVESGNKLSITKVDQ